MNGEERAEAHRHEIDRRAATLDKLPPGSAAYQLYLAETTDSAHEITRLKNRPDYGTRAIGILLMVISAAPFYYLDGWWRTLGLLPLLIGLLATVGA